MLRSVALGWNGSNWVRTYGISMDLGRLGPFADPRSEPVSLNRVIGLNWFVGLELVASKGGGRR